MPFVPKKNLFYIHIPRNGGSVIEKVLYGEEPDMFMKKYNDLLFGYNDKLNKVMQHYTYLEIMKLPSKRRDYQKALFFSVVRNPYHRLVSDFYTFHISQENADKKSIEELRVIFKNFLVNFLQKHKNPNKAKGIDERLEPIFDNYDGHYLPQHKYLSDVNGKLFPKIKVVKYENIIKNISNKAHPLFPIRAKILSLWEKSPAIDTHYINLLTPETNDMIVKYFNKDFKLFQYDNVVFNKPIPARPSRPRRMINPQLAVPRGVVKTTRKITKPLPKNAPAPTITSRSLEKVAPNIATQPRTMGSTTGRTITFQRNIMSRPRGGCSCMGFKKAPPLL